MVRATDLTGLSGAGVEAKQEAQNKDRQDERDVKKEALEKNDQGLSRRVVLAFCYKWFLIALFGACCIPPLPTEHTRSLN